MSILPDYLAPGLRVVFCGTAVSEASAKRGHYYAGPGNEFWPLLYESGLLSEPLTPDEDARILEFGIGLTDLAKKIAASSDAGLAGHYDIEGLVARIERYAPAWLAFHGKTADGIASHAFGHGARWRWDSRRGRSEPRASSSSRAPAAPTAIRGG